MATLDPASPLVLDTRLVGRRAGSMAEVVREIPAPEDFGTDVIGVPQGDPIALDARMESVLEGILVTGSVRTTAVGACVRCLDPVRLEVEATFQELFGFGDRVEHLSEVGDEDADDERRVEDGLIDLEPTLRDTIVPALPFQPVCASDCAGLCSTCGVRLEQDPEHHHDDFDPRWAVLADLAAPDSTEEKRI